MKNRSSSFFGILLVLLFSAVLLTGCNYTKEEQNVMQEYEVQGETNALKYIKQKYGFDATVIDSYCDKKGEHAVDLTPDATGDVYVTMKHNGKEFLVYISGTEESSEGLDNYQLGEITSAIKQKLHDCTGVPAEDIFIRYGKFRTFNKSEDGMISTFFDGENLSEVMADVSPAAVVSYINQDVSAIDMDQVVEETGISYYLLVDYDSKEHYETIKRPYYNLAGSPIHADVEENMIYINGYRIKAAEDKYVAFEKTIIDDMILITQNPEEEVLVRKTTMDDVSKWNGRGFQNAKQVFDAYSLETDSQQVDIYIPVDKLSTKRLESVSLAIRYQREGNTDYDVLFTNRTDDGKYVYGTVDTSGCTDIKFSVFTD